MLAPSVATQRATQKGDQGEPSNQRFVVFKHEIVSIPHNMRHHLVIIINYPGIVKLQSQRNILSDQIFALDGVNSNTEIIFDQDLSFNV